MIHLDINKSNRFIPIIICVAVIMIGLSFCSSTPKEQQKCERCEELEKAIKHLMTVIKDHKDAYYINVLCETDAWMHVDEILYESMADSLNKKVYIPDTLAAKAKEDTKYTW